MKKAIFKKVLALILSVMLVMSVLGGAMSIFAEDTAPEVTDIYGTEEQGFSSAGTAVYKTEALEKPMNMDFVEGFKYWSSKSDKTGYASDFMALTTEAETGDKMLGLKADGKQWDGITTAPFKISGFTKISIRFQVKYNPNLTDTIKNTYGVSAPFGFFFMNADKNAQLANYQDFASGTKDTYNGDWGTKVWELNTEIDPTVNYALMIQQCAKLTTTVEGSEEVISILNGESPYWIKNIEVLGRREDGSNVYVNLTDNVATYKDYQPEGGTAEDGIKTPANANDTFTKIAKPVNTNLAEGFKYWTAKHDKAGFASDYMALQSDGENGYMVGLKAGAARWAGISTISFKSGGFSKIAVMYDYKVNAKLTDTVFNTYAAHAPMGLYIYSGDKQISNYQSFTNLKNTTNNGNWVNNNLILKTSVDTETYYALVIQQQIDAAAVAEHCDGESPYFFRNFRVLGYNEGDAIYTDLATGEKVYENGQPVGGSSEKGHYTTTSFGYGKIPAIATPKNLDFSDGFKYWGPVGGKYGYLSDYATLNKDAKTGENYVALNFTTENYTGLSTGYFRFDGVEKDTKITILMDYAVNKNIPTSVVSAFGKNNPTVTNLYTYDGSAESTAITYHYGFAYSDAGLNGQWNTANVGSFTVNPDVSYRFQVKDMFDNATLKASLLETLNGEPAMFFKNVRLCITNADGTLTDIVTGKKLYADGQPFGGTEEEGIKASVYNGSANKSYIYDTGDKASDANNTNIFAPHEGFKNHDFSEGFKYWTVRVNTNYLFKEPFINSVDDVFEIKEDAEGKYVYFKGAPVKYLGVSSGLFTLPELEVGNKIILQAKVKCATGSAFMLQLGQVGGTYVNKQVNSSADTWTTVSTPALEITDANASYGIMTEYQETVEGLSIRDFAILKLEEDGTYTNIITGVNCYANGRVVGGTFEDGWVDDGTTGYNTMGYVGGFESFRNADFSEGLRFWGSRDNAKYVAGSDYATVKTEGENTYVTVDSTIAYKGIRTALFRIDGVQATDKLTVLYNYKNGDPTKFECKFTCYNPAGEGWTDLSCTGATTLEAARNDAWGVAAFTGYLTVGTEYGTNLGASPYYTSTVANGPEYFIEISANTAGYSIDVDNFQIVKYINGYTFETLDGESIAYDPAYAGTFEDGVVVHTGAEDDMNQIIYHDYGVLNGDFSDGLKYWGCSGVKAGNLPGADVYASTYVNAVTEDGNTYVKFKGEEADGYFGFKTGLMRFAAPTFNIGDYFAVKFDVYDPDNNASNIEIKITGKNGFDGTVNNMFTQCKLVEDKGNGWKTYTTRFGKALATESSYANGDWTFAVTFAVRGPGKDAEGNVIKYSSTAGIDNVEVVIADRGGFGIDAPAVTLDGKLVDASKYGDANNNGTVDLVDLVRMKKYMVAGEDKPVIAFAAADKSANGAVDGEDLVFVVNKLLGKSETVA